MENYNVAVWIFDKAHLTDPGVLDPDHLGTGGVCLFHRRLDIGNPEGNPVLVGDKIFALLLWHPKAQRQALCFDLAPGYPRSPAAQAHRGTTQSRAVCHASAPTRNQRALCASVTTTSAALKH